MQLKCILFKGQMYVGKVDLETETRRKTANSVINVIVVAEVLFPKTFFSHFQQVISSITFS